MAVVNSLLQSRAWHGLLRHTVAPPQNIIVRHHLGAIRAFKAMRLISTMPPRTFSKTFMLPQKEHHLPVAVPEQDLPEQPLIYNRPQRRKPKPWYTSPILYVLAFLQCLAMYLGFWQLRRLKWKVSLIDELEDKLRRDPLPLPRNINMDVLSEFEYRLFQVHGHFDMSRVLFVGPRTREDERGYNVIMPFKRSSGGPDILVNRGFVTNDQIVGTGMNKRLRHPPKDDGKDRAIVVLLPRVYPPSRLALPNEPHNNLWLQIHPSQMAHWLNEQAGIQDAVTSTMPDAPAESTAYRWLRRIAATASSAPAPSTPEAAFQASQTEPVLPVYMEEIFGGTFADANTLIRQGTPVGRPPRIELRNQHAEYAATWFSLSAITTIMFIYMLRRGRRTS